jgi:hypothetical protein
MSSDARPTIERGQHPLLMGNYTLQTPPIDRFAGFVNHLLEFNLSGGYAWGNSRIGKSRAARFVRATLREYIRAPITSFYAHCNEDHVVSERKFYAMLLTGAQVGLIDTGTAWDLRVRLVQHLISETQKRDDPRVVLFMDEAGLLALKQYSWLLTFHNDLDVNDVRLVVVLVGSEALKWRRDQFLARREQQLVGRFMIKGHAITGIQSIEECRTVLAAYDDQARFPAGTNWSFTRFFVTKAYENGWRLASLAEPIWEALMLARASAGLQGETNVPMQVLVTVARAILIRAGEMTSTRPEFDSDVIRALIAMAGYPDLECGTHGP